MEWGGRLQGLPLLVVGIRLLGDMERVAEVKINVALRDS